MFIRLLALIIGIGAIALIVLVARQQQIATVHAIAMTHQRIESLDSHAWTLRAELAELTAPSPVRSGLDDASDLQWQSVPVGPQPLMPARAPEEIDRDR